MLVYWRVYVYIYIYIYIYIWLNYNDLTATSLESWIGRGIIPKWPYFRLVKHYNLPIYIYTSTKCISMNMCVLWMNPQNHYVLLTTKHDQTWRLPRTKKQSLRMPLFRRVLCANTRFSSHLYHAFSFNLLCPALATHLFA